MAADTVKELVARWTVDGSGWKEAVTSFRALLKQAAKEDESRAAANKKATDASLAAAKQEVSIRKALSEINDSAVKDESSKVAAIKATAAAQSAAASAALAATKQQIAAEQLKAATIKTALEQQKQAAANAIAFEKAYQAQLQETEKNKAKAAAVFDAAYQAQVAEVQKNKKLEPQANIPAKQAPIPIVTTQDKRVQLNPENEGLTFDSAKAASSAAVVSASAEEAAAIEKVAEAATISSESSIKANLATAASTDAVALSYKALAKAQLELATANANVAETKQAINSGTLKSVDGGTSRLAQDLAAQDAAKLAVEERIVGLKKAQVFADTELITKAHQQALEMDKQITKLSIAKKEAEALAQANENKSWFGKLKDNLTNGKAGAGIGVGREDRDAIDALMGRQTLGPIQGLISKLPGLQGIIGAAFPIIGIAAFAGMAKEAYEGIKKFREELETFPDTVRNAFGSASMAIKQTNDQLVLADDNIKNTILALEHKPKNNLLVALDEALVKTDELYKKAIESQGAFKKLLEDTKIPWTQKLVKGQTDISDPDILELNRKERAIKDSTKKVADAQRALTAMGAPGKNDTAEQKTFRKIAQDNLKSAQAAHTGAIDAKTGFANILLSNSTNNTTRGLNGKPLDNSIEVDKLEGIIADDNDRKETPVLEKNVQDDTEREKALQEKKRQGEIAMKDARALADERKRIAEEAYETEKARIDKLIEANETAYKLGNEAAKTYYANKRSEASQTYDAEIKKISAVTKAELDALDIERRDSMGGMTDVQYGAKRRGIISREGMQKTAAKDTRDKSVNTDNLSEEEARQRTARALIDETLQARLQAIGIERERAKTSFDEQTSTAEEFAATQVRLINEELEANTKATNAKLALEGQYSDAAIALRKKLLTDSNAAQKQVDAVDASRSKLKLQYEQTSYSNRSGLLNEQMTLANDPRSSATLSDKQDINARQQIDAGQHVQALASQQFDLESSGQKYSETWYKISLDLAKANIELNGLVVSGRSLADSVGKIGGAFSAGSQAAGTFLTSKYAQGVERAVSAGGAEAGNAREQVDSMTEGPSIFGKGLSNGIDAFTKKITAAVGALGGFVSSIANAGSASAGALGGGIAGAGLGQEAGKAASQYGDTHAGGLGDMASAAGPYGALIGAGIGMALGGIMGQKQRQVEDDVNQLSASFKSIMNSYSSNNQSLASTVTKLEALIAQAQADQASTKKGGSQFTDLIKQYNEQIQQLENQQKQIMADLSNQIVSISSPESYQPIISSIQDILKQYTSFVGAAQNATDLGNANSYLTQSLKNLAQTYSEQVNQNEVTALQDALQLNELYNQRNDLQRQYLQQVQSIQGQGTITRGITQSQSKFSQLYGLDVSHANSLDKINQEIALEQYKVDAESKLFNLATTKAGLEAQMLNLQEQGVNIDMNRIAAMQNVLAQLAKTGYSLTNLAGVDTSDPNALLTMLLQLLSTQLGVNVGGVNNKQGTIVGSYSFAGQQGLGGFNHI